MYTRNVSPPLPWCHRAYLHMYNTAYARRNVRQRAQLILQRVLCACFCFFFCSERERAAPWPPWVHPVAIMLRLGYNWIFIAITRRRRWRRAPHRSCRLGHYLNVTTLYYYGNRKQMIPGFININQIRSKNTKRPKPGHMLHGNLVNVAYG